ncbi:MAG: hypothetical protein ACTSYA_06665 [Candidatus Kariarchaeaceae archaeon]
MKNPLTWFKEVRTKREKQSSAQDELERVRRLGRQQEYKSAVIEVFVALEAIMNLVLEFKRPEAVTAREYKDVLIERIIARDTRPEFFKKMNSQERRDFALEKAPDEMKNSLETIVSNFETARYSPDEISFEAFQESMQALESMSASVSGRRRGPPSGKPKKARGKKPKKASKRKPSPKKRAPRKRPPPKEGKASKPKSAPKKAVRRRTKTEEAPATPATPPEEES